MDHKRVIGVLITLGLALVVVSAVALLTNQPAAAQCGSQASSCKNCHETQGQDPVNADGTGWHQSHAFGDFCYICHAGNSQATDIEAAHAEMVAPMSDVQAACAQCHPADLQLRADVYTVALGVPASAADAPEGVTVTPAVATSVPEEAQAAVPPSLPLNNSVSEEDMVDYVARYNQDVLNQQPTNWGNVILSVLLLGLVAVGVILINRREGWISVSFSEKKAPGTEYSADVLRVADQAENLGASGRKALARLLARPAAADLLTSLDKLFADSSSDKNQ